MPETISPKQLPDVNLENQPFSFGAQSIDDATALKLVMRDFHNYESYRRMNHDNRWNGSDALYCAYMPQKYWEGTKVPKASHADPIAFQQIETALPIIENALFSNSDWFRVEPEPGADPKEAEAIQAHLQYLLDHDTDDTGKTARRELDLPIKSVLTYGNGGVKTYYDPVKKRPCIEWVDIRDLFIDPACKTPAIAEARSVVERKFMTVEELWDMRDQKGMKIPPQPILNYFAKNPAYSISENTKTMQEAFRGVNYVPHQADYTTNPADRRVEVLIYYTKNRIIWILGREWVAFNDPNPYGFIPFDFAPCFIFLSRFYAISYPDMLENPQRYSEALYNARLNELALSINPPKVKKQGGLLLPSQERYYPGQTFQVQNPKDDVLFPTVPNATQNIMGDIDYIHIGADKLTGVNGPSMGQFAPGNVNRTASGVGAQVQGASSRLYYIIKNIEDYLICPMLYKMYKLIQYHAADTDLLPALGQNDQQIQIGASAFKSPMRFRMMAATKMLTRDKMLQVLPVLQQYYMNGSFIQQLHSAGKTVDFDILSQFIQDATGTGEAYRIVRPMTPQEQQALNQPPPEAVMQQQMKQADLQSRQQLQGMKSQTAIQVEQIKKQPDAKTQLEMQQGQREHALKLAQSLQEHQQNMQQGRQQMVLDTLKEREKQRHEALRTAHDVGRKTIESAEERHRKSLEHAQKLGHAMQEHHMKLQHAEAQNNEKLRATKLMNALKAQEQIQAIQQQSATPPAGE